jgi:hypothetical protein
MSFTPRISFTPRALKGAGLFFAVTALVVVVGACGKSTSAATPSATPSVSATTQITTNWTKFFAGTTPAAQKIALLQNGQAFAAIINAQASLPIAKGTQAKVISVKQTSPTTATVKYSILISGSPALSNVTGQAVKQAGVWKVGDKSFEALLAKEGQKLPSTLPSP